ncbi:hypothetical protein CATRI_10995 [Corynebacterium atrinae]|uniref:hypothetical protein n=1 Tax=Corynebacterium atrinae TaxID=1336740 RepID=UPI0025B2F4D9|nr:hypothetical protein [Corynebacterium atrinae]WJY64250.1 hypothetical protein CATRI_10995 [Corynebacterium atrinae]
MEFLYDRDCGFCQRGATQLQRLAPGITIRPASLRNHAIFRYGGQDWLGHHAIGAALAYGAEGRVLRGVGKLVNANVLDRPLGAIYRLIASQRHRLSRLVGAPACAIN